MQVYPGLYDGDPESISFRLLEAVCAAWVGFGRLLVSVSDINDLNNLRGFAKYGVAVPRSMEVLV